MTLLNICNLKTSCLNRLFYNMLKHLNETQSRLSASNYWFLNDLRCQGLEPLKSLQQNPQQGQGLFLNHNSAYSN